MSIRCDIGSTNGDEDKVLSDRARHIRYSETGERRQPCYGY